MNTSHHIRKYRNYTVLILFVLLTTTVFAQTRTVESTIVPHLVKFSGTVKDAQGTPLTGTVGITFALYKEEQGGSPLWLETQNVQADARGHYTVYLGASNSSGLPQELFVSGQARWLSAQPEGQTEQPRTLLLSVPYALKAGDAATVGGLPPSAFVLAAPGSRGAATASSSASSGSDPLIGGSGTAGYLAAWADNNGTLGNSILFQKGTGSTAKIGINESSPLFTLDVNGTSLMRGLTEMATMNYATKTKGYSSQPFNLESSAFNSSTNKYTLNHFQWQAEPTGNNTTNPSATLNLLYGTDPNNPTETGLNIASNGQITFVAGQTFPGTGNGTITGVTAGSGMVGGGTSGNVTLGLTNTCASGQVLQWNGTTWVCTTVGSGTITGVTAGTDLTGGGTNGAVTLNVDTSKVVTGIVAGTDLTGGGNGGVQTLNLDTTKVPQLNTANTFTGNQTVNGNLTSTGVVTGNSYQIGSDLFAYGSHANGSWFVGYAGHPPNQGTANTALGDAALAANTSNFNTAVGFFALGNNTSGYSNTAMGLGLSANTTGAQNTAAGYSALNLNTTGSDNTGIGQGALIFNATGNVNTALGFNAGPDKLHNNLSNSTAIGAFAEVDQSNSLVLGSINGVNGATADTFVGIGTTAPSSTLDVEANAPGLVGPAFLLKNNAPVQSGGLGNSVDVRFALDGGSSVGNPNAYIRVAENGTGRYGSWISFATIADGGAGQGALERMRIRSDGFVGIGTTVPDALLTVNGGADKPGGGSWATFSDRRLKNLDGNYQAGLDEILKLQPVRYRYKADNGMGINDRDEHIGFVAQDVQRVIPEAVSQNSQGYLLVNNDPILWTMLNAIKEQQSQISEQRKQIESQRLEIHRALRQIASQDQQIHSLKGAVVSLRSSSRPMKLRISKQRARKHSLRKPPVAAVVAAQVPGQSGN